MEIISESKKVKVSSCEIITIQAAVNPITEKRSFLISIGPDDTFLGKRSFFSENVVIDGLTLIQ